MSLLCYNRGCAQRFDPETNTEGESGGEGGRGVRGAPLFATPFPGRGEGRSLGGVMMGLQGGSSGSPLPPLCSPVAAARSCHRPPGGEGPGQGKGVPPAVACLSPQGAGTASVLGRSDGAAGVCVPGRWTAKPGRCPGDAGLARSPALPFFYSYKTAHSCMRENRR